MQPTIGSHPHRVQYDAMGRLIYDAIAEKNCRDIAVAIAQGRALLVADEVTGEHLQHLAE